MGAIQVKSEWFDGQSFHLQNVAETKRNRDIFKKIESHQRKMAHTWHRLPKVSQPMDFILYCQQIMQLKGGPNIKSPDWEIVMHWPYDSELTLSDHHFSLPLQNPFFAVKLTSKDACENHLVWFFPSNTDKFYHDGRIISPVKLQKFLAQNGASVVKKFWFKFESNCARIFVAWKCHEFLRSRSICNSAVSSFLSISISV